MIKNILHFRIFIIHETFFILEMMRKKTLMKLYTTQRGKNWLKWWNTRDLRYFRRLKTDREILRGDELVKVSEKVCLRYSDCVSRIEVRKVAVIRVDYAICWTCDFDPFSLFLIVKDLWGIKTAFFSILQFWFFFISIHFILVGKTLSFF